MLAAFSFARLLETIPLTPSGVGFVETGAVAALIGFGGAEAGCAAAVFLFRGFTYLAEIPLGGVAWVVWATNRRWRRPAGDRRGAAAHPARASRPAHHDRRSSDGGGVSAAGRPPAARASMRSVRARRPYPGASRGR